MAMTNVATRTKRIDLILVFDTSYYTNNINPISINAIVETDSTWTANITHILIVVAVSRAKPPTVYYIIYFQLLFIHIKQTGTTPLSK